ncbi:HAD family phosphatase [Carnobacteriaceae bacterium zg-ZUI252]|nr:HAD family phosphatase [Carnobacteriaceae bacterium zg-ZUI252]MBS4770744.1 HAD family phosphatase [Carnobacteriaceae bacterium zg-ZUI240]
MIKLIAIDMDGTLLSEDKTLHQEEIDAIRRAINAGYKVVICTGRALAGVKPYVAQLNLSNDTDEYAIISNGCSTHYTKNWDMVSWHQLTKDDMLFLYAISKQTKAQLTLFDDEHYFVVEEEANTFVWKDCNIVGLKPTVISIDEAISGKYTMFQGMFLESSDVLDDFQAQFEAQLAKRFSVVRSQDYIFETMPFGVNKASALADLAKKLNILPEEVMAIGDANNDLEMLSFAGVSVAMGNASQHIKEMATYVTLSNEEHGVAHVLNCLVNNGKL